MAPPPDLSDKAIPESDNGLAFKPVSRRAKPQRRWGLIFSISFVVAAAGYVVFEGSLEEGDEFRVPLVRAKEIPIKTRPKNPGGRDVQHRDKLVYDRLPGGVERSPVEVLNPPPEAPLPPPQKVVPKEPPKQIPAPVAPPVVKTVPQGPSTPTSSDVASIKQPVPAPMSPNVDTAKPKTPPKPKVVKLPPPSPPSAKSETKKPEVKAKPKEFVLKSLEKSKPLPAPKSIQKPKIKAPVPTRSANASGKFLIQLAAVRSVERATTEWSRLRRKHPDLLKGLSLTVTKADLGPGKGTFYRLRAGLIAKESAAKSLCARLIRRKIGCLVVRGG
jgi:hypothetical protein